MKSSKGISFWTSLVAFAVFIAFGSNLWGQDQSDANQSLENRSSIAVSFSENQEFPSTNRRNSSASLNDGIELNASNAVSSGLNGSFPSENSSNESQDQETSSTTNANEDSSPIAVDRSDSFWDNIRTIASPDGVQPSLGIVLILTVLSLAPAVLIMTTSFVRIITVLSILRQAIGAGQLPPNQVLTALSLFLTLLIMTPTWTDVYNNAVVPFSNREIDEKEAFERGVTPIRTFMCRQIERQGNADDIRLFMQYIPNATIPEFYEDVPLQALFPAFMLSELKTAFLIGFQLFIPFLIIDMVVSSVLVSMGMMMLPPIMISLPFKLMLFVLMDGWTFVVKALLESFTLLIV